MKHASRSLMARILMWMMLQIIRLYQITLAPFLGGHCRYEPSCSHYAMEAIVEHGPWRGGWMALKRLLRCHPLVKGGYDPVPPRQNRAARQSSAAKQLRNQDKSQ